MNAIIAAIIGGVIAIGTTIAGAVVNKNMSDDANAKAQTLWDQQQADNNTIRNDQKALTKWEQKFRQNQEFFQQTEAKKNRAERKESSDYQKRQQQFANNFGIINGSQQAKNTFFELWNRRAKAA